MKKAFCKALKYITALNVIGILLFSQSAFAETEKANVSYNGKEKTVTVIANAASYKGAAAVITISKDAENTIMNIVRTGADGVVTHSEVMPESFEGGRYDITVSTKEKTLTGYFIYPLAESINSVLPIINSKENAVDLCQALKDNSDPLAIDMLVFEEIADRASNIMFAQKPEGGWNESAGFLKSYNNALAAVALNDGAAPADVFSKYGAAFDFDAKNYTDLTDAEKAKLDILLKNTDYTGISVADAFFNGKAVSQIAVADSWSNLMDKIDENENVLKLDTTYLEKLKNKDVAYQKLFGELKGDESIESFRTLFLDVTKNCYEKESNSGPVSSSKGSGGGGGGGISSSKDKPTEPTTPTEPSVPTVPDKDIEENTTFSDMAEHWAKDAVNSLAKGGIIGGFPDGTFKPDEAVTRAQFTVMVARALGLSSDEKCALTDVEAGSWYEERISAAVKSGIVTGKGDGKFYPDEYIKRQDAFLILYRAYKDKLQKNEEVGFTDNEKISDYAKDAVEALSSAGIVKGSDNGEIKPLDNTSRAEVATMLERILKIGKE